MAETLHSGQRDALKKEFLRAFRDNGGFSRKAAEKIGIHYATFCRWKESDKEFTSECENVLECIKDRLEQELYYRSLNMRDRDTPLLAMLNAKARDRGYGKQAEDHHKNALESFRPIAIDIEDVKKYNEEIISDYLARHNVISVSSKSILSDE